MSQTIQRVYVIGLGAIGLKYASRLYDHDPSSVTVIADAERVARFEQHPPTVNGKTYRFDFVTPDAANGPAPDLILVTVKASQLDSAIEAMRPFVGEHTAVMSLLNGIDSEAAIARAFGEQHVPYAHVYADAVRDGYSVIYKDIGKVVFGPGGTPWPAERLGAIAELFRNAAIPCEIPDDMPRAHWSKFMLNVGVNQVSAVLHAPYGAFRDNPHVRGLAIQAAEEVIALAGPAGVHLQRADLDRGLAVVDSLDPAGKTSMLQDVEAGRETEVDLFAGTVVALGRQYDVPTPVNDTLLALIKAIDTMH